MTYYVTQNHIWSSRERWDVYQQTGHTPSYEDDELICEAHTKGDAAKVTLALNLVADLELLDKTKWDWGIDSIGKVTPHGNPPQYDVYLQDATGDGANIENEPDLLAVIRAAAGWARQHGRGEGTSEQRRWRE